jgi:3-phenylpropionate/trans-cinnamate dioxygenase ferredoxin subunit
MVFEKVAETAEIPSGQTKTVQFGAEEVLLANVNGVFYAIGNVCTHERGKLSQGTLQGTTVTCPRHKAQFDVTTGKVVSSPKILFMHPKINNAPTYSIKVEGTAILLEHKE